MYIKIYNKFNPRETMIVQELSDYLFQEGWRLTSLLGTNLTGEELYKADEDIRQISIEQHGF